MRNSGTRNRVFFPQACLDQWAVEGKIEVTPTELLLGVAGAGRRYTMDEAVHVVVEVTGTDDPHGIIGKVKSKSELESLGAEILENSMIIGDNAYDVVPGWVGAPKTPFAEYLRSPEYAAAQSAGTDGRADPTRDEEVLAFFAGGTASLG